MPRKTKPNGNPDPLVHLTYPASIREAAHQHRRREASTVHEKTVLRVQKMANQKGKLFDDGVWRYYDQQQRKWLTQEEINAQQRAEGFL